MLLSIEFPRLQRVTVCTLVWHGLCSFVEDCLLYHILGLFIFSSDGYKKSVEQSCKIVLKVLISWCCFSSWC